MRAAASIWPGVLPWEQTLSFPPALRGARRVLGAGLLGAMAGGEPWAAFSAAAALES